MRGCNTPAIDRCAANDIIVSTMRFSNDLIKFETAAEIIFYAFRIYIFYSLYPLTSVLVRAIDKQTELVDRNNIYRPRPPPPRNMHKVRRKNRSLTYYYTDESLFFNRL